MQVPRPLASTAEQMMRGPSITVTEPVGVAPEADTVAAIRERYLALEGEVESAGADSIGGSPGGRTSGRLV